MNSVALQAFFPENVSLPVPSLNSFLTFYGLRSVAVCT